VININPRVTLNSIITNKYIFMYVVDWEVYA